MQIWGDVRNLSSINIPRCFCIEVELTGILLKDTHGWDDFEIETSVRWLHFFLLNIISCAYLLGSGLKLIFHWKAQSLMNFKSLVLSLAEVLTSWATENKKVSSANNLHLLLRPFGKSLTYIKNKRDQEWNLVVLQIKYQSKTNTVHLKV